MNKGYRATIPKMESQIFGRHPSTFNGLVFNSPMQYIDSIVYLGQHFANDTLLSPNYYSSLLNELVFPFSLLPSCNPVNTQETV